MLKRALEEFIEDHGKIMLICIGNDMRGDDGIGPLVAGELEGLLEENTDIIVVNTGTVPENYTGLIRKVQPSHIIFIDAVEMKMAPGDIKLVQKDEIANYSISTHAMPLSFMIRYIETFTDASVLLIGIQPKNIELYEDISDEVKIGAEKLTKILKHIFHANNH